MSTRPRVTSESGQRRLENIASERPLMQKSSGLSTSLLTDTSHVSEQFFCVEFHWMFDLCAARSETAVVRGELK